MVEAGYEDGSGFAGGLDGGGGAEGHGVAGAEDGAEVGVLTEEGLGEGVGFFEVVAGGFDGDDLELGLTEGGFEAGAALLAGEVGGRAVDDRDGGAWLEFFGEGEADLKGCGLVVWSDEGGWQVGGGEGGKANIVKSPMVGTAYLAPEPGAKPFVTVGANIKKGQTIIIIEAMKTMNHVPSTKDGVVKKILVTDGEAVEFDQDLILVE